MPLAAADAGLDDYRAHLLVLHAWITPLESWLAGFHDGPQDGAVLPVLLVPRGALIAADLADPAMAILPPCPMPDWPAPDWRGARAAAYRWGVCYVLEGAQLGGEVLYRRLGARLAPHPLNYLHDPAGPGPRWRVFLAALRAALSNPAGITLACDGARAAFDAVLACQRALGPAMAAERP